MRRREFVGSLLAVVVWPLCAQAQQSGKLPTLGFQGSGSEVAGRQWSAAFTERLRELGWIENRTVVIEFRWAEGRTERFKEIISEFVRLKVDVVITYGNTSASAAKEGTTAIPIVFAAAGDPMGTGLVSSLARPGGNVTGLSIRQTDLAAKRLEILKQALPGTSRLAIVANAESRNAILEMHEIQEAASASGLHFVTSVIRRADEIAPTFASLKGKVNAVYLCSDPLLTTNRIQITTLATDARLSVMSGFREYTEAGGLMSYGPHFPDLFRRAAEYVDKILRGAKPGDLPVEEPTKFELVLNVHAAKSLGLTIPESLLARADEVIE